MNRLLPTVICTLLYFCTQSLTAQVVLVEDYRFGDFESAEAISVSQFRDVFIVDGDRSTVFKYDLRGSLLAEAGGVGWDNTQFDRPKGLDASLGLALYVADMGNNRVSRFDRDLHFMASVSGADAGIDHEFGYPLDVLNSSLEQLYVLDGENNRVLVVSGFNRVTDVFGDITSGDGRLLSPVAMAMGKDNTLFVLESDRVAAFDLFGNFLFHFGNGRFTEARGITASRSRVLVVTDNALHFFSTDGTHLQTIERESMVFAGETGAFRDAAYTAPFLLLLTNRSCILFPNN